MPIRNSGLWTFAMLCVFAGPAAAQNPAAEAPKRTIIPWNQPIALIKLAGPIVWPLLACSVVAITFALERAVALRRRRVLPGSFLKRFRKRLDAGELDRAAAMEYCRSNGSPLAHVCLAAARLWGYPTSEIHKAVGEAGAVQTLGLRQNLRALQSVANISMLIGLFGTVLGVIHAFNNMTELRGVQRGEELSRGISEALLATAFGLAVSIPALALYTYLAIRVERLTVALSEAADEFADRVSAEGLAAAKANNLAASQAASTIPIRDPLLRR